MKKEQLTQLLKENFISLNDWAVNHNDDDFAVSKREGKWTTGQHIDHLIRSTAMVTKGFSYPKFILKWKFGVNNRTERTFEETYARYKNALVDGSAKAYGRYLPGEIMNNQKSQKLTELKCQGKKFIKVVNKQSEENLSKYIIPHPVIGLLTLREMAYFTAFHTAHHHNILKEFH